MRRSLFVALLYLHATTAFAGLEPTKPSQLADVFTSQSTACKGDRGAVIGIPIDRIANPDGTTSPLTIPPKQVFVLTSLELVSISTAGHAFLALVQKQSGGANGPTIGIRRGMTDSTASLNTTFEFGRGAVIKAGTTICVILVDASQATTLVAEAVGHGYFAKDN